MSRSEVSRRMKLAGVVIILAELLVQQFGFGLTSTLAPLAASLVVTITGSLAYGAYIHARFGLGIREFDRKMWKPVARLAASNTLIGIVYILAVQALGLPLVALIGAFGVLSVGFKVYWGCLWSRPDWRWASLHLGMRSLMLTLVFLMLVILGPLTNEIGVVDLVVGLGWAAAAAWCFWNYLTVVFGPLAAQDTKAAPHKSKQGLAVANLLSIPATAVVVWPFGGWGELFSDFSPMNWLVAGLAGVLIIAVPAHMQIWATTKKVSDRMVGVLYALDTPIAAVVGAVGVLVGLFTEVQRPGPLVWVAIGFMVTVGILSTLMGDTPPSQREPAVQD